MRRFRYRHYYYPRQRTAYGPRNQSRPRQHVHTSEEWALSAPELHKVAIADGALSFGLIFDNLAMPHGGTRLVVYCPNCGARRTRLYVRVNHILPAVCRRCAGLVYWRQYEGRRLEAADPMGMPERALWAAGRYRGWQQALHVLAERALEHIVKADLALTLRQLEWARYLAWCRRLDELNAAVALGKSYRATCRKSQHTAHIIRLHRQIYCLTRKARTMRNKVA